MKCALAFLVIGFAYGQVLHSTNSPKLKLFSGDELADITNHQEADAFCKEQGRILASKSEWCHYSKSHSDVEYGEVPIRVTNGGSNQIEVEDHCDVCQGNSGKDDNNDKSEKTEEKSKSTSEDESGGAVCSRPTGCVGRSCAFTCDLPQGYYPDPDDCSAYCFCTGSAAPSRWEQVAPGLVWDPYCGGSQPLDASNKPLGGMTGGCANWPASTDVGHCTPASRRRELKGKFEFMLCTLLPKAPTLPQTCATAYDDPHVKTFDGLSYDCQGDGDFILSKSLDTDFELQGRFFKLDGWAGTTTTGAVLTTGVASEPKVEVAYNEQCNLHYYIDDEEHELDSDWSTDGTMALGTDKVNFFRSGSDRYFHFQESGVSFHITLRYNHVFGCFINVKLCLPDEIKSQRLVGLFGSPDGNQQNDFMGHDGTDLEKVGNIWWGQIYEYCTTTWCLGSDSLFKEAGSGEKCAAPYDDTIEQAVKNADDSVKETCGDNVACFVDTVVTGDTESGAETLQDEEDLNGEEAIPDEREEDSDNADHCNGQTGNRKGSLPEPAPKSDPTIAPTSEPTAGPTSTPTDGPTAGPTDSPTADPTASPSGPPVAPPAPDQPTVEDQTTDKSFVKGDPHFKTFGGELYDYHGECDLVLLHNPDFKQGMGMDIHVRTKIQDFWSSVESAAIKLGDETLEIQAVPDSSSEWLWVNGKVNEELEDGKWYRTHVSGFLVRYKQSVGKRGDITREAYIYLEGPKEVLVMKTFKSFVRVDVNWKGSKNYDNSLGLLGSHAHNGKRLARDGKTFIANHNAFGQEWQVMDSEPKLFHSYEGAVVGKKCILPPTYESAKTKKLRKRRLAESGITTEIAETACSHLNDAMERKSCVFDILATNDVSIASVW